MPQLKQYGNPISSGSVGPRQTPSAPTPPTAIAPIQIRRLVRNGLSPQVELTNRVREAANFAALYRSKEVFAAPGYDGFNAPGGNGVAYRFAFHTGPYTHALYAKGLVYPPTQAATQSKYTVSIYSDAAMTALVASADFFYGAKPAGVSFGWRLARVLGQWLDVAADTDYYGSVTTSGNGVVGGLSVFDMQSLTENYNGYLATNLTMHSPVLSNDRSSVSTMVSALWKRGASQVLNWAYVANSGGFGYVNHDASGHLGAGASDFYVSTTSATLTNIIDRSSTTISASTPGYTIDMRNKARVSQLSTGVPCVMKVWGSGDAGAPHGDGQVVLKNSAGTTIATVGAGWSATPGVPGWLSTTFNMPAVLDKYDLQFKLTVGTRFYAGAVSICELE